MHGKQFSNPVFGLSKYFSVGRKDYKRQQRNKNPTNYLHSLHNKTMSSFLHFEPRHQPLLSPEKFRSRLLTNVLAGLFILALFLGIGVWGYHATCGFSWIDSLLNASMILSGMGPTNVISTNSGKCFASIYALVSGVVFITTISIVLAPVVHRVFHRFHLEDEEGEK